MKTQVAVVGDEAETHHLSKAIRQSSKPIEVVGCYAGIREALAAFARTKPHIVLADASFREIPGVECIRRLRRQSPDLKALLLVGAQRDHALFEALAHDLNGCLLKSSAPAEAPSAIERVMKGKFAVSARLMSMFALRAKNFAPAQQDFDNLTWRQWQIVGLLQDRFKPKEIAQQFDIAVSTTRTEIFQLRRKLTSAKLDELLAMFATLPPER